MVETTENQICSSFHLFKPYLLCVVILVSSVVLTSFLGLGLYEPVIFTISILILSTSFIVIFTNKRKVVLVENPGSRKLEVEEKIAESGVMETVSEPPPPPPAAAAAQEADHDILNEFQVESLDLATESESSGDDSGSGENLERNWMISGNLEQNPEISYDSTSEDDDEGLIEIAIPSNDTSSTLSEEGKENLQSNLPTFMPESIFKQQDLVELLAEMNEVNEEENLIEIDISMGSIKCSRFEIEA
ncbi:hypothetical protein DITRI_Ditri14bG0147700 [Diplodiscus trichospermus]